MLCIVMIAIKFSVWGCSNDIYLCQEKPSIKYQEIDIKNMCVKLVLKQSGEKVCGEKNDYLSRSWVVTRCTDHPSGCINCCWDANVRGKLGDDDVSFGITKEWQCSRGHHWQAWEFPGDVTRVCKHLAGDVLFPDSHAARLECGVSMPKQ